MTVLIAVLVGVAMLAVGLAAGYWIPPHGRKPASARPRPVKRILLPFTGQAISRRAFDAAVRLARAENATIMPAFLARVPMQLPLDSPLPGQCGNGLPLLEVIEQRAYRTPWSRSMFASELAKSTSICLGAFPGELGGRACCPPRGLASRGTRRAAPVPRHVGPRAVGP